MHFIFFITITTLIAQCASNVVPQTRIFGGKPAKPGKFPYQAYLFVKHNRYPIKNRWIIDATGCGGTLISNDFVLTAAHCLYKNKTLAYGVRVTLGAFNIKKEYEQGRIVKECPRDDLIPHPMYNHTSIANDIALIKLSKPVKFSDFIQPATLPNSGFTKLLQKEVISSGWGRTEDNSNKGSDILLYMHTTIQTTEICDSIYDASKFSVDINRNLCLNAKGKSTCYGDSGGPHVINEGSVNTLVGITSYGNKKGCTKGYPQVLTRVTYYVEWINSVIGNSNQCFTNYELL